MSVSGLPAIYITIRPLGGSLYSTVFSLQKWPTYEEVGQALQERRILAAVNADPTDHLAHD